MKVLGLVDWKKMGERTHAWMMDDGQRAITKAHLEDIVPQMS